MTTPASLWRNAYDSSRIPYKGQTSGSISSAPFVLNKDLETVTTNDNRPWEVYNGDLTNASHANVIPIACPGEYSVLEIWMFMPHNVYATEDTPPVLNIYGRTPIQKQNRGNLPSDHATIANFPTNLDAWWAPLTMVDRTAPSYFGVPSAYYSGINPAGDTLEDGSGSFAMHSFNFKPQTVAIPSRDGVTAADQQPVSIIGDGTESGVCFPASQMYLNGSDVVMATVHAAYVEGSSGTAVTNVMLMGRFLG